MSVRGPRKVAIDGALAPYRGSFVGREQDLAVLEASLEDDARLTTLHGPGGVGKTRLLHQWLEVVRPRFERVLYVELADARTSGDVIQRVAEAVRGAALGATATEDEAARRVGRALARALPQARKGRTLLALDNLEQLEPRAFELLPRWLAQSNALRVVVTSRVRLGAILMMGAATTTCGRRATS